MLAVGIETGDGEARWLEGVTESLKVKKPRVLYLLQFGKLPLLENFIVAKTMKIKHTKCFQHM